jgi:hypothetical protein
MAPQTTLAAALQALAYLLNQNATPNAELTRRTFFVVSSVQRLNRSFDWLTMKVTEQVTTDASGTADISDLNFGAIPAFDYVGPGDMALGYSFIAYDDLVQYGQGDRQYGLIVNEDGEWELHTTEPNTTINISYYQAPDISTAQAAFFPAMVIAKGALIYYRQAQDPEADTSVEEDQFRQETEELMEAQERRRPQKQAMGPRERYGGGIGST